MKKVKNRKKDFFITKDDITGWLFVLPFLIGVIFLFGKPMIQSLVYSFHELEVVPGEVKMTPTGWKNYINIFTSDAKFLKDLWGTITGALTKIPIIMFFSIFMALLLNEHFPGRLIFRCIMFLPVIFSLGSFMSQNDNNMGTGTASLFEMKNSYVIMESTGVMDLLDDLLANFGLPDKVVSTVRGYLDNIFSIAWASGIQIVLFIIGLQAIPSYLYEVCELEGATKWETFWKITFPLLSPSMLLCMIYTIIVQFNSGNTVMTAIEDNMRMKMHYACAQTWMYTLVVGAFVFVAYRLVAKRTVYLD